MKGLLLKDLYTIWGYMKAFLLLCVVLLLGGRFAGNNSFLTYYSCILSALVTVTLIAYDEREKWDIYTRLLPCTKAQYVSSKYLLCLILNIVIVLCICLLQMTAPNWTKAMPGLLYLLIPLSLLPSAIMLPFIFWFGAEKGRLVYSVVLGIFCGGLVMFGNLISPGNPENSLIMQIGNLPGLTVAASTVFAYGFSWWLSVQLYKEREL